MNTPSLEARISEIGGTIAARMGDARPGLFSPAEWKGRVIARAMANEPFRVALFRFVDVLPAVTDDKRLLELAREYFDELGEDDVFGWGMKTLSRAGLFRKVAAKALRGQVEDLATQFIAGETPKNAAPTLARLREEWSGVSVDLLGEVTVSTEEAARYRSRYLELIERLAQKSDANVSVKLSALDPLLSPVAFDDSVKRAGDALRPIFSRAGELGVHVQVDMEHYALKDITLNAVLALLSEPEFARQPSCGIVLQAYLKSAEGDLARVVEWVNESKRPLTVRLVKGAYWDQEVITHRQNGWEVPVWEDKGQTDLTYEAMTATLLENIELMTPAIAGHNLRSIAHAAALADEMGVPNDAYEFQVIYGMAEPLRKALVAEGYRVRCYTPVGAFLPGMAYLVRRLMENTANSSMLRRMYGEREDTAALLAPPEPTTDKTAPTTGVFMNEPATCFVDSGSRKTFADALEKVREALGGEYAAVIDGAEVTPTSWLESFDPAVPGRRVGRVADCTGEQVHAAVAGAAAAWPAWADTPAQERAELLRRTANMLRRDRHELAALELFEVGKSREEADADVTEAIDFLDYYADQMERLAPPVRLAAHYPGEVNETTYRARGVVAVISPWNFPLAISCGMVAAALVTGNSVVFKPSERAPVCARKLFDAFVQAGVPPGVLQFVPGAGAAGATLAADPRVDMIAFTGSRKVGLAIHRQAAKVAKGAHTIRKVVAEMGGKNAIIVDETADLDEAVLGIVHAAFGFQGQKCSACSRVIAVEAVHDELVARLTDAVRTLPIGPPEEAKYRIGPLVDARAVKTVRDYIAIGKKEGTPALIVEDIPQTGCYVGPAIFTVRPHHRLAREEVFGPVLAVLKATGLDDALAMANDCDYALTGGLFSRSPAAIKRVRQRFRVGNLYINRGITGALVGRQPFGGFRLSGLGSKAGGPGYLEQFMVPVTITENEVRRGFAPEEGV